MATYRKYYNSWPRWTTPNARTHEVILHILSFSLRWIQKVITLAYKSVFGLSDQNRQNLIYRFWLQGKTQNHHDSCRSFASWFCRKLSLIHRYQERWIFTKVPVVFKSPEVSSLWYSRWWTLFWCHLLIHFDSRNVAKAYFLKSTNYPITEAATIWMAKHRQRGRWKTWSMRNQLQLRKNSADIVVLLDFWFLLATNLKKITVI